MVVTTIMHFLLKLGKRETRNSYFPAKLTDNTKTFLSRQDITNQGDISKNTPHNFKYAIKIIYF